MRDIRGDDENLAALALLYANNEMDAADAAAFERRLSDDQRAREALCQAVELAKALEGCPTPMPNPSYRQAVRLRLQPQGFWQRVASRRPYRGHPAFWSALGAAAVLLAVCVNQWAGPAAKAPAEQVVAAKPQAVEPASDPALDETALAWAEIP